MKKYFDFESQEVLTEEQLTAFYTTEDHDLYPTYEDWLVSSNLIEIVDTTPPTERDLFDAISDFAEEYKQLAWNDDENVAAFRELVDMAIAFGKIPEANRNEPSTWGGLQAAVIYYDNRLRFCYEED